MTDTAEQNESRAETKRVVKVKLTIDTEDVEKGIEAVVAGMKRIRRETRETIHAVKELERQVKVFGQSDGN